MDGVGVGRRPLRDEILGLGQVPRSPRLRKKKRIRARVRGLNYRADCTSLGREYEKFIVSSATAAPGAYSTRACRPRWVDSAGGGGRRRMETDGRRKGRRTPKPQSPTPPNSSAAIGARGPSGRRRSTYLAVVLGTSAGRVEEMGREVLARVVRLLVRVDRRCSRSSLAVHGVGCEGSYFFVC